MFTVTIKIWNKGVEELIVKVKLIMAIITEI